MNGAGVRRRARIDLEALAANIAEVLALDGDFVLDARADAYGHGIQFVAPVALWTGCRRIRVTDDAGRDAAAAAGFDADAIVAGRDPVPIDPLVAIVYGVDGGRPVMTLSAEIVAVKRAPAGAGVSYGYTYRTEAPTTLALVALGYADGVPRLASNRAEVHLAGLRRPLAGRVAMDQFVVDCADVAPEPGEEAVLFGDPAAGHPGAAEWGEWTRRHPLLVTAGLGMRVTREAGL